MNIIITLYWRSGVVEVKNFYCCRNAAMVCWLYHQRNVALHKLTWGYGNHVTRERVPA